MEQWNTLKVQSRPIVTSLPVCCPCVRDRPLAPRQAAVRTVLLAIFISILVPLLAKHDCLRFIATLIYDVGSNYYWPQHKCYTEEYAGGANGYRHSITKEPRARLAQSSQDSIALQTCIG